MEVNSKSSTPTSNFSNYPSFSCLKVFETIEALEKYSKESAGSLLCAQLASLDVGNVAADHVATHLGAAVGITTALRSIPHHLSHARVPLPLDVCKQHELNPVHLLRMKPTDEELLKKLSAVVYDTAARAHQHYASARALVEKSDIPTLANSVFLYAYPSIRFLHALEKEQFHIFAQSLQRKDWKLPIQLWLKSKRKSVFVE